MDAKTNLKNKLPSRHVTEGPERAPHRSYYYAMGLTTQQIHQPFVGVASCWNEAAPCNIALMRQAQAAKKGVAAGGGTPREFCTITVTDGIAMGHEGMKSSLPSREVIADSVELTMRGHGYDALIGLAGCDKSLPGMMMAMCRLNVPSIFIYGGSILPGTFKGQPVTVQDVFEAVGKFSVGKMSPADLDELEHVACPSAGACGAQFTANTMACVSEAIGLALPYSAGAPAPARDMPAPNGEMPEVAQEIESAEAVSAKPLNTSREQRLFPVPYSPSKTMRRPCRSILAMSSRPTSCLESSTRYVTGTYSRTSLAPVRGFMALPKAAFSRLCRYFSKSKKIAAKSPNDITRILCGAPAPIMPFVTVPFTTQ
jgi:dihydroxy-acid dehydratase